MGLPWYWVMTTLLDVIEFLIDELGALQACVFRVERIDSFPSKPIPRTLSRLVPQR